MPKHTKKQAEEPEEDVEEDNEDAGQAAPNVLNLARDPAVLAALQAQLGKLQGTSSGYVESLGPDVQRRINALKNYQVKHALLNAAYEKERAALELKYELLHKPLYDKRTQIISGAVEPTEEEATFEEEDDEDEEDDEEEKQRKAAEKEEASKQAPVKGIPHFWLTILQQCDIVASRIEEHDIPVLESLIDITTTSNTDPGTGFTLNFHFAENEYFTDAVLTKSYTMDLEEEENALMYTGPTFDSATGCVIHWKEGKNVGIKAIKKKQKKKGSNQTRVVTKFEKRPTFFQFFSPPPVPTDDDENADEIDNQLEEDFEVGDTIREKLVPNAVLWFTGEALDYEDNGDDDFDYGGEGEEGDDDVDEDYMPPAKFAGQKPDCKQA